MIEIKNRIVTRLYKLTGCSYPCTSIVNLSDLYELKMIHIFSADVLGTEDYILVSITDTSEDKCDEQMEHLLYDEIITAPDYCECEEIMTNVYYQ